jgi:RimJ/RimL family protein N-acetyltransferase
MAYPIEHTTSSLVGTQVRLRPLERSDLNQSYLAWLNDPEVTHYLETGTFPTTREDLDQFYDSVRGSRNQVIFAIEERKSGRHIGNVKLGPIHWVNRSATFGILIGEKEYWGKGIGKEATRLMVEYGFYRLNLHRINLGVFAGHDRAIRSYAAIGFEVEGRFRQAIFRDGEYKDHLWMGLLRSEYKRIEQRQRHNRCYIYLRGRSVGQIEDDCDKQLDAIRKYCETNGITIAGIFREQGASETEDLKNRPVLRELLSALQLNGVELILVEKLDCLARDLMIQESIIARVERCGFEIRSVTEPEFCSDTRTVQVV